MTTLSTIRIFCWPPLPDNLKSALQSAVGGPLELVEPEGLSLHAQVLEARLLRPDIDLVLLDEAQLPQPMTLASVTNLKAVVLQLAGADQSAEQDATLLVSDWCSAIDAGVQDIMSPADLLLPNAALRLRAAFLRQQIGARARNAFSTDLATGLPHRQQLLEHMNHLLALREREPAPMAVLVLCVDGIATTLQRQGAEAAAVLRRKLAVRLRSGLRASDVVAALDGENFAVLLSWVDIAANVEGVVAKLLASARRPFTLGGQPVGLAVRAGIGRYPEDGNDAATLLQKALIQATRQLNQGDLFARQVHPGEQAANDDAK